MGTSNVCNCTRNYIIQFTAATWKLSPFLMLLLLPLASAGMDNLTDFYSTSCSESAVKYTSALEENLKVVMSSLIEKVNKTGSSISWSGQNGDKVYGVAQCRGDLNASACGACVSSATKSIAENCRRSISKSICMTGCFLRYATHNFYSQVISSDTPSFIRCDDTKINGSTDENARGVDSQIDNLLTRLVGDAVSSNVGYGTLSEEGFYSLAQCWSGLDVDQCNQCLNSLYRDLSRCPARTSEGAAFISGSCRLGYSKNKFYGDGVPLLSALPSTGSSRATDEGKGRPKLLGLSISGAVLVVMLVAIVVIWKRKVCFSKQRPGVNKLEHSMAISKSKLNYKYQTLKAATNNFSLANKIGQGGFGSIYKGILLDGREIAVKRLLANREQCVNDLFNEVNLISRVQHKNLVKLLGCSVDSIDRLLVYEYLPNKSLDHFLFDKNRGNILDWQRRFEIILGIARGLAYLHQESDIRIIHRDIKASNILLDQHFKPKIADFGLVRYFAEDETHLTTGIVGTRGYMAPEYLVHGHLTEKVDVYAFGVLVLEIISRRKNNTHMPENDMPSLLTMVWNHYLSSTLSKIIDVNIQQKYEEALQVVHIALLCTQASATLRPSMSKVIGFLTNKDPTIPIATPPPFIDSIPSQSNNNTSIASIYLQPNTSVDVASSHFESNIETNISHVPKRHVNQISNIDPSFATVSTSSFSPR